MRDDSNARTGEAGFSLIELIIAMAVTMIIMGAVYGLIAGGQDAFRREPELAERQQNIRMAMDLIMRDVSNAASGLPTFVQGFTTGLDACAACPPGPDGALTDELEILTNSESRDTEPVCRTMGLAGGNGDNVRLIRDVTLGPNPLPGNTVVVPFTANGQWTLRNLVSTLQDNTAAFDCIAGNHTFVDLFDATGDPTGLNRATACEPNGWGNATAGCELVGLIFANLPAEPAFQVLARGIENMQVQYLRADGDPNDPLAWQDSAPAVVVDDYATLVTQVRVTLAARSEAQNIAGATTSAAGGDRIRGTLMSSASPRATLMNITLASPAPLLWR